MKFKNIKDRTSIMSLENFGFYDGDYVIVLFDGGDVLCGNLKYITEYSTLFDTQLVLEHTYWKTVDMSGAVGISKVIFDD